MSAFNTHLFGAIPQNDLASKVSHCLHETAQPLTVLQGILELALLQNETVQEYRDSVERALSEVTRVIDRLQQARNVAADSLSREITGKKGPSSYV